MTGIMMNEDSYITGCNIEWNMNYELSDDKVNTLKFRSESDYILPSRNFLFWLKGFVEGSGDNGLDSKQVEMIKEQLDRELTVASLTYITPKDSTALPPSFDEPIC